MGTMRIVICDDHQIIREAVKARIEAEPDLEVVGEAADGRQMLTMVAKLKPDLLLTDIEMPGSDGIAASTELIRDMPDLRVLVFSAHEQPELVALASESGTSGFLGKSEVTSQIVPAIRAVIGGGKWFPKGPGRGEDSGDELRRLRSLTRRERQILELFATGMRADDVSAAIGIRPSTVYTHVRNAIHKLNVDSRTQAVAVATRYAYLSDDLGSSGRSQANGQLRTSRSPGRNR